MNATETTEKCHYCSGDVVFKEDTRSCRQCGHIASYFDRRLGRDAEGNIITYAIEVRADETPRKCPTCGHRKVTKNGRRNNRQLYECQGCGKKFRGRNITFEDVPPVEDAQPLPASEDVQIPLPIENCKNIQIEPERMMDTTKDQELAAESVPELDQPNELDQPISPNVSVFAYMGDFKCSHCQSVNVERHGNVSGRRRFKCHDCNNNFAKTEDEAVWYAERSSIHMMNDGHDVTQIADTLLAIYGDPAPSFTAIYAWMRRYATANEVTERDDSIVNLKAYIEVLEGEEYALAVKLEIVQNNIVSAKHVAGLLQNWEEEKTESTC